MFASTFTRVISLAVVAAAVVSAHPTAIHHPALERRIEHAISCAPASEHVNGT